MIVSLSKGSTHVVGVTNNLLNKYNCPTNACENFSIDALTLKILLSSSIKSLNSTVDSSTSDLHVYTIGFNTSKIVIIKEITTFTSYSKEK
jgi:hypothetical protein